MPSSSPQPISHATVQHIDEPNFINSPEPARAPALLFTDNLDENIGASDSNDDSLPFLGDPEPKFFSEMTPPSISLIGAAAFKQLIDVGEEVYTINIQPTIDYLDIEAL